ncbi:TolC family protein [Flavivirga sp. 57AJ16]|uniref:TolC family protein n=1 Tax=Flavivirga sp. 57AJ16 TaxID=3025307 RepID=UPI00236593EE|nr:TolC family protein [Flavivirga sp. 57AJ16]MDD7888062.1 TolC family protein [Flavivirga sp. 57AJ16]
MIQTYYKSYLLIRIKKNIIWIFVWNIFFSVGFAQNNQQFSFTLENCIALALENNNDLKSSSLETKSSKVNYKQSINQLLPTLNANYNIGVSNGRSIDPFTNSYSNQELTFSSLGVNLSTTVFNGFRVLNSIKQSKLNLKASEMALEEARQNLILQVTVGYIQILNSRDQLELSRSRLVTTETQLKRLKTHYDEGIGNPVDYTDMQGQYAIDKVNIVEAENNFKSAILDFVTLLNIDLDSEKDFENISGLIASDEYALSANDVYKEALRNLATFKSKQFRIDAVNSGIKVTRSGYYPEISVFGQLNTNYSSAAEVFTETGSSITETGDFVTIANQDYPVLQNERQFAGSKISYEDQFDNNLNSVVGLSVRIPLFNGFKAKNLVQLQKIKLEETQLELENTKLLFKQAIEQAYNNMESAFSRYHILLDQVASFKESYRINEVRFKNGVSNIVEYITSKNNMDTAQLNLNKARYEYLLRVKILDYYRGL